MKQGKRKEHGENMEIHGWLARSRRRKVCLGPKGSKESASEASKSDAGIENSDSGRFLGV
jgi:hypothetical protein